MKKSGPHVENKTLSAKEMEKINDKILEDNNNIDSDLNGAVDGRRC